MWPWLPPVGFRIQDPGDSREGAHMAEMEFQEEAQGRSLQRTSSTASGEGLGRGKEKVRGFRNQSCW